MGRRASLISRITNNNPLLNNNNNNSDHPNLKNNQNSTNNQNNNVSSNSTSSESNLNSSKKKLSLPEEVQKWRKAQTAALSMITVKSAVDDPTRSWNHSIVGESFAHKYEQVLLGMKKEIDFCEKQIGANLGELDNELDQLLSNLEKKEKEFEDLEKEIYEEKSHSSEEVQNLMKILIGEKNEDNFDFTTSETLFTEREIIEQKLQEILTRREAEINFQLERLQKVSHLSWQSGPIYEMIKEVHDSFNEDYLYRYQLIEATKERLYRHFLYQEETINKFYMDKYQTASDNYFKNFNERRERAKILHELKESTLEYMNKNREREKERLKQDGVEAEEDENLYEKKITQKLLSKETTMPWKLELLHTYDNHAKKISLLEEAQRETEEALVAAFANSSKILDDVTGPMGQADLLYLNEITNKLLKAYYKEQNFLFPDLETE